MPPKRRKILEVLSRDELLDILDSHQLDVDDRRKRDLLVDCLVDVHPDRPDKAAT